MIGERKSYRTLAAGFILCLLLAAAPCANQLYVENELVVGLEEGLSIDSLNNQFGTSLAQYLPQLDVYLLTAATGSDLEALTTSINEFDGVAFCHPNYLVDPLESVQGSIPFNDVNEVGSYGDQQAAQLLNLNDAHGMATGNQVTVGVIDGGVNYLHDALASVSSSGYDYVNDDYDAYDEPGGPNSGHGTFVAGVVHLVAPSTQIRAYRVTDLDGLSDGYLVAEAILQAVDDGCNIVNLSLVMMAEHEAINDAVAYARDNDVLVIVAAGNSHDGLPEYPASDTNTIAVAAVDSTSLLADFSNFGDYIDVCAPGVNIYSPYLDSSWAWWGGTSFAAPFVTAEAALILSLEPELSWQEVKDAILATAEPIDDLNPDYQGLLGAGIINPLGALMQIIGSGVSLQVPEVYPTIQEAIEAASHGDTILVGPGTYYGRIDFIGKTLKLISTDGADATILKPANPGDETVRISGSYLPGCEIRGFTFTGNLTDHAIFVNGAAVNIADNVFRDIGLAEVDSDSPYKVLRILTPGTIIQNNLFYRLRGQAINRVVGVSIIGNVFYDNWAAFKVQPAVLGVNVFNNVIANSTYYGVLGWVDYNGDMDYNCVYDGGWEHISVRGDHDLAVDPLLMNPENEDFRLMPVSPCVDAGNPDPLYDDPDGTRSDIGAGPLDSTATLPVARVLHTFGESSLGILSTKTPLFKWTFYHPPGGYTQQYFEIQVGTDDDWSVAELWDSGPVYLQMGQVQYAGSPLPDYGIFHARVRVADETGVGSWSELSFQVNTLENTSITVPGEVSSVAEAVALSGYNDTVYVEPGEYTEQVVFPGRSVKLLSTGGKEVTTIQSPGIATSAVILSPGTQIPVIDGFTIIGSSGGILGYEGAAPIIRNNDITGGQGKSISLSHCANPVIENNYVHHGAGGIYIWYVTGAVVRDNTIGHSSSYGLYSSRSSDGLIERNTVYRIAGHGINLHYESGNVVQNNTVVLNEGTGIYAYEDDIEVRNNIVAFNRATQHAGLLARPTSTVEYNNVYGNTPKDYENVTLGPGSISQDPLLADTTANDFTLLTGSRCIDAGHPDPAYEDPDGSRGDIGSLPYLHESYPYVGAIAFIPAEGNSVTDFTPEMSWRFYDTAATVQTQYELEIGLDDDWTIAETWSTGAVNTDQNSVVYSGPSLEDMTKYYIRLRAHNGSEWSLWSESWFFMKSGNVIVVPDDVSSINEGIMLADEDDTVLVTPGTYVESVWMMGKPGTVVMSSDGPDSTTIRPPASSDNAVVFVAGNDTTSVLAGFTIEDALYGVFGRGGGKILGNRFRRTGNRAIEFKYGTMFVARDNVVDSCGSGIVGHRTQMIAEGNTITNSRFENYLPAGAIIAYDADYSKISRNIIVNNVFAAQNDPGILLQYSQYCEVYNNTVTNNSTIFQQGETDLAAIMALWAIGSDIRNNIVAFNEAAGILNRGDYDLGHGYNNVYGNGWGNYDSLDPEMGSISADPLFVDTLGRDYSLQSSSPCIDAGDPAIEFVDLNGTRNDMGAVPYAGPLDYPLPTYVNLGLDEILTHVVADQPTFCWSYVDTLPTSQAAYEIQVGTDYEWSTAEMWSSGEVASGDTSAVYAGNPLVAGEEYYMRVRVSNGTRFGGWQGLGFRKNTPTAAPTQLWPPDNYAGVLQIVLRAYLPPQNEGDTMRVEFQVLSDPQLTDLVYSTGLIFTENDTATTEPIDGLEMYETYYWRCRGFDGTGYSTWTEFRSFTSTPTVKLASVNQGPPNVDTVYCDEPIAFKIAIKNDYHLDVHDITNGFRVYSTDGASLTADTAYWAGGFDWGSLFGLVTYAGVNDLNPTDNDDTIGFGASVLTGDGLVTGAAYSPWVFEVTVNCEDIGKTICVDSAFFPPGGPWRWQSRDDYSAVLRPTWDGPHCFTVDKCCDGMRGDANMSDGQCNVADLTYMVEYLFGSNPTIACPAAANVNGDQSGDVNVSDLTYLVDYLFRGGDAPYACSELASNPVAKATGAKTLRVNSYHDADSTIIWMESDYDLRGVQLALEGTGKGSPELRTLGPLDIRWRLKDNRIDMGILDLEGGSIIEEGTTVLCRLAGDWKITEALISDEGHGVRVPDIQVARPGNLPTRFELAQNYPNPFNPSTTINFALPKAADVTIEVFNILGQQVTVLVDKPMDAGYHSIVWEGTDGGDNKVATGVYLYRLRTESFTETRKMLLLK